jgi:hypothetical protein
MRQGGKRIGVIFLIICQICILGVNPSVSYAFFGGFSIGQGRAAVNSFLENDLNMNVKQSIRPMTEGINIMDRKAQIPTVTIRFSTPNPKPGEIITASADVAGITNPADAYYMWYLKGPSRKVDEGMLLHSPELSLGDLGDSKAQHAFAVQAQTELYFDPMVYDQKANGGDADGNYLKEYPNDKDDDGYVAPLGGGNAGGASPGYCYIYDVESGEQFELKTHNGEDGMIKDGCESYDTPEIDYVARCMISDRTIECPTIVNQIHGEISASAEAGSEEEGSVPTASTHAEVGGGGGARMRNLEQCLDTNVTPTCHDGMLACPSADGSITTKYKLNDLQTLVPTPYCIPKNRATGRLWIDPNQNGCPPAMNSFCFDGEYYPTLTSSYRALCGRRIGEKRPVYYGTGCYEYFRSGLFKAPVEGTCEAGTLDGKNTCPTEMLDHNKGGVRPFPKGAGDGDLNRAEEIYYHLDTRTDRTTPLALNDEALIMGLGVKDFTWKYKEGDEIGVIVEAQGFAATKHGDATYQTVFAMLPPGCNGLIHNKGQYNTFVKSKSLNIKTAEVDLNKCILENNLYVKPGTSEYDALNVSLSHGSNQQTSIPSGLSEPMRITATAGQVQGGSISQPQNLYYEWSVRCDGNDITDNEALNIGKTEGMNLPALDLITNFPEDTCFADDRTESQIEVTAKINEPRKGGGSNFGQSTITFTSYNAKDSMLKAYKTKREDSNNTFSMTEQEICNDSIDRIMCRVMNNEVIALTIPDKDIEDGMISWQVNGKPYTCDTKVSKNCDDTKNTKTIIVPMTGRDGDTIAITAHMNEIDQNTNQSRQIMRVFRITDPEVLIRPVSGAVPKVMGVYSDLDDNTFLNESTEVFNATDTTITLVADLYPSFLNSQDGATYEWTINGRPYGSINDKQISISADGLTTVGVRVQKEVSMEDRWALNQSFGAELSDTSSRSFTHKIEINTESRDLLVKGKSTGFFATVAHNSPEYLLFILKITLLMSVMLFIPSVILSAGRK